MKPNYTREEWDEATRSYADLYPYDHGIYGRPLGSVLCSSMDEPGECTHNKSDQDVLRLIDGDWLEFALCVGSAFLYFLAFALSAYWSKHSKSDLRYAVIIVEAVSLAAVYFFPQNWPVYTRLYPCVFATAFQWSIFCGAQGFNCATIFNSNNYRQFSSSFAEVYLNKDPSFRPKMKFFGCTLLFYHFGVVYVYLILKAFSSYAIWSGLLPLVVAAVMIHLHRKELAVAKVE